MPLVIPTPPTNLPTPPSTQDPANFDPRADAFLGQLPTFQTQTNQLAQDTYTNAVYAQSQATTATNQAAQAGIYAASAAASATTANTGAGAGKWVSGTNYTDGTAVWSTITYQTYRKKGTAISTIDPAIDSVGWVGIAGNTPEYIIQQFGVI